MDGRQGSEQKPGRGRRLGRGVLVAYLSTAAVLAILRVSLLAWWVHLSVTHQMNETVYYLFLCLRPEFLLDVYTRPCRKSGRRLSTQDVFTAEPSL
jgi:hypothetical protein